MKKNGKKMLSVGMIMMVGFASLNCWFHKLTGVHMAIYTVTDWLGLVPIFICVLFGGIGLVQLVKRRNIISFFHYTSRVKCYAYLKFPGES